jgi:hypothetical protein
MGLFGDAYATMWVNWVQLQQGFPPWKNSTNYVSYPFGESFWSFHWFTSLLVRVPQYLFSEFFGAICGYNMMVLTGFMFTSLCTWGLIYWLTKNQFISILAGIMFGFGPFMQSAITGHINYVFIGVYPLLLYLILQLSKRSVFGQTLTGIILGAYSYIDGYYFIPAATTVLLYFIYETFLLLKNSNKVRLKSIFRWFFYSAYSLMQVPLLILLLIESSSGQAPPLPRRDWHELFVYSIKWWHLLMPSNSNMYFGKFYDSWQTQQLGGSNFSETGLYAGAIYIIATIVLLTKTTLTFLMHRNSKIVKLQVFNLSNKNGFILLGFLFLGLLLPMRPWIDFFEVKIPMPSGAFFYFLPSWRTISRWGLLATISIIAIGSIGLSRYISSRKKMRKFVIIALASTMVFVDLGFPKSLNPTINRVAQEDGPYVWIANNTNTDSVILDVVPYSVDGFFAGMALTTQRRLANTLNPPNRSLQSELLNPGHDSFVCSVNYVRADYVIIHPEFYAEKTFPEISGLEKIWQNSNFKKDSFAGWNFAAIYKPLNTKKFQYLVNYSGGYELVRSTGWNSNWELQEGPGMIKLHQISKENVVQPKILIKSNSNNQGVQILQDGLTIWSGNLVKDVFTQVNLPTTKTLDIEIRRLDESVPIVVEFANLCK